MPTQERSRIIERITNVLKVIGVEEYRLNDVAGKILAEMGRCAHKELTLDEFDKTIRSIYEKENL